MKWSDIPFQPTTRTLRQFAGCWVVGFLALGASQYFLKGRPHVGLALAVVAVLFGVPGLIRPTLLRWIFVTWMVVAFPIGWAVSMVMLAVLYFVVLTPVAALFRLAGRDILARRKTAGRNSFWSAKDNGVDVRRYFNQY